LDTIIKISQSTIELAWDLAHEMANLINESANRKRYLSVALSGGSTPKMLFSTLGENFSDSVHWEYVHFFWGDERCVPPEDPESNYGMTKKALFDKISIPSSNIHRIRGEMEPEKEAVRYSKEIAGFTRKRDGLPVFDLVILGLGEDGHTASIFPGHNELLTSEKICKVAVRPENSQKRITITGRIINNADNILFLVTGANKAEVVSEIIESPGTVDYPAAFIEPVHGVLKWYLDIDAAGRLNQWA
jgi:6-phosphogluconolactonase